MKKESLSIIIVKTLLAVIILVGMGTIIIGGVYIIGEYSKYGENNEIVKSVNQETENYYNVLGKKCKTDCCLTSLKIMEANNYKEVDQSGNCPDGFEMSRVGCPQTLEWCESVENKNCIEEGGIRAGLKDKCCDELKFVNNESYISEAEICVASQHSICLNCGNGICGIGENRCNCPEDCEEQIDTSDWQTYWNEKFGFEVKYLEEWEAISSNMIDNSVHFGVRGVDGEAVIAIEIFSEKSVQEEINKRKLEMKAIDKNVLVAESEVFVNSIKAKQIKLLYQSLGSFPKSLEISTYFNYENNLYTIHLSTYERTEQEARDIYNLFLSSFKFTEK